MIHSATRRFRPARREIVLDCVGQPDFSVEVHVLQGERPLARDNRTLGRFHLDRHSARAARCAADRGHVRHRRQRHRQRARPRISGPAKNRRSRLRPRAASSKDEVDRMMKEAEANAEEDQEAPRRNRERATRPIRRCTARSACIKDIGRQDRRPTDKHRRSKARWRR